MFRINFLAILCLGLLTACGSNELEDEESRSKDAVGQAHAAITLSTDTITFEPQRRDSTSEPQELKLTNPNPSRARTCSLTIEDTDPFYFLFNGSERRKLTSLSVPAKNTQAFDVVFKPSAAEDATGTITVECEYSTGTESPVTKTVNLFGTGLTTAEAAPQSLTFKHQKTGTQSQAHSVVVTNTGSSDFTITKVSVTSPFLLLSSEEPDDTVSGDSNTSQPITVAFRPTQGATGDEPTLRTGTLTITTDEPATITVALFGTEVPLATQVVHPSEPLAFDVGSHRVSTTSTTSLNVTVLNAGDTTLKVTPSIPPGSPFSLVSPPSTPINVQAGKELGLELEVAFLPTEAGHVSGDLIITTDETDQANKPVSFNVSLSGEGLEPKPRWSSDPLAFGDQRVNTSKEMLVTLENIGNSSIVITDISESNNPNFTLLNPPNLPFSLEPNAEDPLTLEVRFHPSTSTTNPVTGAITLSTDDPVLKTLTLNLAGRGVKPHLVATPDSLNFQGQLVNTTSEPKNVTLTNSGSGPIVITSIVGPDLPVFAVASSPDLPTTLAADGGQLTLSVTFSPGINDVADFSDELKLVTADPDLKEFSIALSGRGEKPTITLDQSELSFGEQRVGTTATKRITVTNTGARPLEVSPPTLNEGLPFTVSPNSGFTLAKNQSQEIEVRFSPNTQADFYRTLSFETNDPLMPSANIPISGKGVKPTLKLEPRSLYFGPQRVGVTSPPQRVTVRNSGTGTLHVSAPSLSPPFKVLPSAPFNIPEGDSVDLSVTFTPTETGDAQSTLTLTTNDPDTPSNVSLSGIGVKPRLVLTPSLLAFGPHGVGSISTSQLVTVTNQGEGPVLVSNSSITPGKPFSVEPIQPVTLGQGDTTQLRVTFHPTEKQEESATLSLITDEETPSANEVALTGSGVTYWELTPRNLEFENVEKGKEKTLTVTLSNTTGAPVTIAPILEQPEPFFIENLDSGFEIPANSSISVNVTFRPTTTQTYTKVISFTSDAANSNLSLTLSGKGALPALTITYPDGGTLGPLAFGGVQVGMEKTLNVQLTNVGDATYYSTNNPSVTPQPSAYRYLGPQTIELAPGKDILIPITFTPTDPIHYPATLTIPSNIEGGTTSVTLTGMGATAELDINNITEISFGDTPVGTASNLHPLTLINRGQASMQVLSMPVRGDFKVIPPAGISFPTEISGNTSLTVNVQFVPSQQGDLTGDLTIHTNIPNKPPTVVQLKGSGTISELVVSESVIDFGGQRVGETSDIRAVKLTNEGGADLIIERFTHPSVFTVTPATGTLPLTIGGGRSVDLHVSFTPTARTAIVGQLVIDSNATIAPPPLTIKGRGIDGQLAVTPPGPVDLGAASVGGPGNTQTVTLTNIGEARLTILEVEPPDDSQFTISGLLSGTSLEPEEPVSFTVRFQPEMRGYFSPSAIIRTDSVMNPALALLLLGQGKAPHIRVRPETEFHFGSTNVRESVTKSLSISNEGENTLSVSSIIFEDGTQGTMGPAQDFSVSETFEVPFIVEPGAAVTVPLKFTPREVDLREARAVITSNDRTVEVKVIGFGTSPNLTLTPESLAFGNVVVGHSSEPLNLSVKNEANGDLTLYEMTLGGTDAASFTLTKPELPLVLTPTATTDVSVTFTPNGERPSFSAQLQIKSNDPVAPSRTVRLSGSGVRQQIQLSETSLHFGPQLIKNTSLPRELRVINNSSTNVTLTTLAVEGDGASQFVHTKLPLPYILGPGQEQQLKLEVTFTPQTEAEANGKLKLEFAELPQQPLEVTLRGSGIPSVLAVSPSPLDFGGVRAGGPIRERRLTVSNLSNDPIVLAAPEVRNATGEPFVHDGATLQGHELGPNETTHITVGYQPQVETLSEATLSINTESPQQSAPTEVLLKGRAMTHLLSVDVERLDFGRVDVGAEVEPKVVTITNKSAQQQRVEVMLKDLEGVPFKLDTRALAEPIPPGGSLSFSVAFDPKKAGVAENEVQIWLQSDPAPELRIPVTGHGRALSASGGGCAMGSTQTGAAVLLAMLALLPLTSRRRRG